MSNPKDGSVMTQSTTVEPSTVSATKSPSAQRTSQGKILRSSLNIPASDGHQISMRIWRDESIAKPLAILQILHGMAEHCERYDAMAQQFATNGYIVIAHDHRAHGKSTTDKHLQLGHYEKPGAWKRTISDSKEVADYAKREFQQLPLVLFGHSMGSFVALGAIQRKPNMAHALVLSGSSFIQTPTSKALTFVAKFERYRLGPQTPSKLLNFLTFGSYNRPFAKEGDSGFNWLSRDAGEVEKYANDPLCGFICSTETWVQFGEGVQDIFSPSSFKKLPIDIPYYIMSGTADPVGANGKGATELADKLAINGVTNLHKELYLDARHELINEINRDQVLVDLQAWLDKTVA